MKRITALEIGNNLPMRVKSLNDTGIFKGEIIRFYEVNKQGVLLGKVVGNIRKSVAIFNPNVEFELLENGE